MMELSGRAALVTGGGTGIGKVTALALAAAGADVAVCGVDLEPLEQTVAELERLGVHAAAIRCDVSREEEVRAMLALVAERFGRLDVLVNNASVVGPVGPVETMQLDSWQSCLDVNVTGVFLCCRESIPLMKRSGGGSIVNVSSNVGKRGIPNRAPYVCSKFAVIGLTQTLAHELGEDGIRVNAICPGPVMTERLQGAVARMAAAKGVDPSEVEAEWVQESPMKRFATTEECAKTILYLASDASSGLTGQSINVTAGAWML